MTSKEKYSYWETLSDYDVETAKILLNAQRSVYVAYLCQQSVERLVKGMYVYHSNKEAPKSHNISFLISKITQNEKFLNTYLGNKFESEKDNYLDFLLELMFYHVSDYPFSYKNVMDRFIDEQTAINIYNKTNEVRFWLKSFQELEALSVT